MFGGTFADKTWVQNNAEVCLIRSKAGSAPWRAPLQLNMMEMIQTIFNTL